MGRINMEDIEAIIRDEYKKDLLTEEQFNEMKSLLKPAALKYIKTHTNLGLKECAIYYDFYHNENYK